MHLFYNQLNKDKYSFYDNHIENQTIFNKPAKEPNVNQYNFLFNLIINIIKFLKISI